MTKIVDYHGHVLAEAMPGGETMVANATIDLDAQCGQRDGARDSSTCCRASRFRPMPTVTPGRRFREANGLDRPAGRVTVPERGDFEKRQMADIEKLAKAGLI